jgi:WD40 repeat protein
MLQDGSKIAKYHNLTSYEDYITDLIISEEFKYFITSTMFGQIYVWKLNIRARLPDKDGKYGDEVDVKLGKNLKSKSKLIHSYTGHTKKVTSLVNHPINTIFISASLDNTVRIWCLDKFTELYCFNLVAGLTNIKLLNDKLFACFYYDKIKICRLQHLAQSFCNPNSKVKKIAKCFNSLKQKELNNPIAIYVRCKDNSTLIYRPNGNHISTIYPPPTAKKLVTVEYSMALNRFFILLASGTICVYKFDKETAILEKLQYPNQLKDSDGRAINQTITTMSFCNVIPPRFDCEIVRERSYVKEEYCEETKSEDMMVLGFSKGTIVFVNTGQIETIYARFSIHRQEISKIQQIQKGLFISICKELTMNIWGFTSENICIYKTFKIYREINDIA